MEAHRGSNAAGSAGSGSRIRRGPSWKQASTWAVLKAAADLSRLRKQVRARPGAGDGLAAGTRPESGVVYQLKTVNKFIVNTLDKLFGGPLLPGDG